MKNQSNAESGQLDLAARPIRRRETPLVSRYLAPTEIIAEGLAGTIMALSFTLGGSLIVKAGRQATKTMLLGVLGCNIAWGIIDGTICLMGRMLELSRRSRLLEAIRKGDGGEESAEIVAHELDGALAELVSREELDRFYRQIASHLSRLAPERIHLEKEDYFAALATFVVMCVTTIPAVAPFFVFRDLDVALRVSNVLLLTMLFLSGYRWARITRSNPWVFGSAVLLIGLVMVAVSMWLEG